MRREDLMEFAARDRAPVEALRAEHWRGYQAAAGPLAALDLADGLRRHAIALHPGWPDEEARSEDLAVHRRVSEALRSVRFTPDR
jgi:hypothetical protein